MQTRIPAPDILNDLISPNWRLRWQVLEHFHRLKEKFKNHSDKTPEQRALNRLGIQLAHLLNGPEDHNLHLILCAANFLGGTPFLLRVFQALGIDDSETFYPGSHQIRSNCCKSVPTISLLDYFHFLFLSHPGSESTNAAAARVVVRVFPAIQALSLLLEIRTPETRLQAFLELARKSPDYDFNSFILTPPEEISRLPELLWLVTPPLEPVDRASCLTAAHLLAKTGSPGSRLIVCQAAQRLGLSELLPLLKHFDSPRFPALIARSRLGDSEAQQELAASSASWRSAKRIRALPGLAYISTPLALQILAQSAKRTGSNEQRISFATLGHNPHPKAFTTLHRHLLQSQTPDQRRYLLSVMAQHPSAGRNPTLAHQIAEWYDEPRLYPEILQALKVFGDGLELQEISSHLKSPLIPLHLQELAVFMAHHCSDDSTLTVLRKLLFDPDWSFSYRLLVTLSPRLQETDFDLLLDLLRHYEENPDLSLSQRLISARRHLTQFSQALAEFLNQEPEQAQELLRTFIGHLSQDCLPNPESLKQKFRQRPEELQKILLDCNDPASIDFSLWLPRLYFQELLEQTGRPDGNCLVLLVNRTHRYNGFLRQKICQQLSQILEQISKRQTSSALPGLFRLLDFIRQRSEPDYESLRNLLLSTISYIQTHARELKIIQPSSRQRDLKIISQRHKTTG